MDFIFRFDVDVDKYCSSLLYPCLLILPSSMIAPVLTLTCYCHLGQDLSNRPIYKTLESDLHLGRHPDKPQMLR